MPITHTFHPSEGVDGACCTGVQWEDGSKIEMYTFKAGGGRTISQMWLYDEFDEDGHAAIRDMKQVDIPTGRIPPCDAAWWRGWHAAVGALLTSFSDMEAACTLMPTDFIPTESKSPMLLKSVREALSDDERAMAIAKALLSRGRCPNVHAARDRDKAGGLVSLGDIPSLRLFGSPAVKKLLGKAEQRAASLAKEAAATARKERARGKKLKRRSAKKRRAAEAQT